MTDNAALTRVAAEVGVPGLHPHELRHTAASLAIASGSGADVKVVQQMLGHKSATTTLDLYEHLFATGRTSFPTRWTLRERLRWPTCTGCVPIRM